VLIGYARVSTDDENLDFQRQALKAAGCRQIFEDRATGALRERNGLARALKGCGAGDVLVVWRLDRLGRSLGHLIELLHDLASRGVEFRSLSEAIDTTTPTGRLTFHVIGALAEFERAILHERTSAGLKAAKARGVKLGRKPSITPAQAKHARQLIESGENPRSVARTFGIGRTTLYRHLARASAGAV
jgi:DNA invertase Pin-like site-specific DNA recombinase